MVTIRGKSNWINYFGIEEQSWNVGSCQIEVLDGGKGERGNGITKLFVVIQRSVGFGSKKPLEWNQWSVIVDNQPTGVLKESNADGNGGQC